MPFLEMIRRIQMPSKNKNGFTLIELLVAMAVASILGAIFMASYSTQVRAKNTQEILTDMNQTARAGFELLVHEIQMAGLDSTEDADAEITIADVGELAFSMDRGDGGSHAPDGDTDDPNETVRYALNTSGHLGRDTGGGLQPLIRNVDALNFVYLAADDTNLPADADTDLDVLATPVATQALRDRIRAIQVMVVVKAGETSEGLLYEYTNTETYPNLRDEGTAGYFEFNPPSGDHFRRLRLATTVLCRNVGF